MGWLSGDIVDPIGRHFSSSFLHRFCSPRYVQFYPFFHHQRLLLFPNRDYHSNMVHKRFCKTFSKHKELIANF